jgi:hypothetical protein
MENLNFVLSSRCPWSTIRWFIGKEYATLKEFSKGMKRERTKRETPVTGCKVN